MARLVRNPGAPWHHCRRTGNRPAQYGSAAVGQLTSSPWRIANTLVVAAAAASSSAVRSAPSSAAPRNSERTFEQNPWPAPRLRSNRPRRYWIHSRQPYSGSGRNSSSNASADTRHSAAQRGSPVASDRCNAASIVPGPPENSS
jgi:hypothetical protein